MLHAPFQGEAISWSPGALRERVPWVEIRKAVLEWLGKGA